MYRGGSGTAGIEQFPVRSVLCRYWSAGVLTLLFSTLMGFIAGLNSASCSRTRLKKAWSAVPADVLTALSELESLMSPKSSWKLYRATVREARMPCLPYLGCYLGDLTFVDEGNPDELEGMINFEKYLEIWRYIREVESFKAHRFSFPQVEPLYTLLIAQPGFVDRDLYDISLVREARSGGGSFIADGKQASPPSASPSPPLPMVSPMDLLAPPKSPRSRLPSSGSTKK